MFSNHSPNLTFLTEFCVFVLQVSWAALFGVAFFVIHSVSIVVSFCVGLTVSKPGTVTNVQVKEPRFL